jgi:hypothetical protein
MGWNMAARYILGCLAVVFLVLGTLRSFRDGRVGPAARTWLLIGTIFALVSASSGWLSGL